MPSDVPPLATVRALRWIFRRDEESICCRLMLTADESAYELNVASPWPAPATAERFASAVAALQRQATIERQLVGDGWSLDRFETTGLPVIAER